MSYINCAGLCLAPLSSWAAGQLGSWALGKRACRFAVRGQYNKLLLPSVFTPQKARKSKRQPTSAYYVDSAWHLNWSMSKNYWCNFGFVN